MADAGSATEPVVVALPAEIDISNSGTVATRLRAAIAPGAGAVVVDLTVTAFCGSSGVRVLVLACKWAAAGRVGLRFVAPAGPTRMVLELTGLDRVVPVYPSLSEALAGGLVPGGVAGNEPGHR